jgi:hypothetical protein
MNNHWLSSVKKKKLLRAIDDVGMEVWSSDGTLEDLLKSLNREQRSFLLSMQLADFSCEINDETFRIELTFPT